MSVKDLNKVINVKNGTKGNIEEVISYEDFCYNDSMGLDITTNLTLGEYLLYRKIRNLLLDEKDIIITIGYKG